MSSRTAMPIPQPARAPEPTKHIIASGDTLSAIADRYYSDGRKADLILAANPSLKNPRNLKIGTEIIIPPIGDSIGQTGAKSPLGTDSLVSTDRSGSAQSVRTTEASGKTYTVQQGDTLYGISQRVYGAGSKWESILKNNRALLRGDPKRLAPGMVLQIP
jgi:nucleoid-associated protein YgaU